MSLCSKPLRKKRRKLSPRERMLERYKWMRKPDPALQAELECTSFSLTALAAEIQREFFPELNAYPHVIFSMTKYAAYIVTKPSEDRIPFIVLNPLYNHPDTPEVVVRAILKHELIHFVIPRRDIDGKPVSHPPEFWDLEKKICPERRFEEAYDCGNFYPGLFHVPGDERHESQLMVRPGYVRKNRHRKRLSLEQCVAIWSSYLPQEENGLNHKESLS